jgi:hypothetical protein
MDSATKPAAKIPADGAGALAAASTHAPSQAGATASGHDFRPFARWGAWLFSALPGWMFSGILHVVAILVMALVSISLPKQDRPANLMVLNDSMEVATDLSELDLGRMEAPQELAAPMPAAEPTASDLAVDPMPMSTTEWTSTPMELPTDPNGLVPQLVGDVDRVAGGALANALSGRSSAQKKQMLREAGGTAGSEAAVALALKWFANHQNPDGSWNLDHRFCPNCRNRCRNPGDKPQAPFGATGLALLPFLGAGNTHLEGDYKVVVERGISFLLNHAKIEDGRAVLTDPDGSYYSHALCAIALCEAYAMTKDPRLAEPAQMLINETVYAQDPRGGGWRYERHQPGDTSVLGWQLMALKSAHMAGLIVPPITAQRAAFFLDTVESMEGYKYRYKMIPDASEGGNSPDPSKFQYRRSTSAVGLLSRMYLGWERNHPKLTEGVAWLGKEGPAAIRDENLYLDYYATQVMRHYGGEPWEKWNEQIRDFLVEKQSHEGHEEGSWFLPGSHNDAGGRIYCTSLATLILEVYYRHLPLYQEAAAEEEFPL